MNRDDITRMAREAGFVGFDGDNGSLRRFAALVSVHTLANNPPSSFMSYQEGFEAGRLAEREAILKDGWRQCAKDQRTTQFCGMLQQAVLTEREACAKVAEAYEPRCDTCPSGVANAIRARGQA